MTENNLFALDKVNCALAGNIEDGSLDIDKALRAAISAAIKGCSRFSRHDIVDEMSKITGEKITIYMLNNWSAESKKSWNFPAKYLPALYVVTKSARLFQLLANPVGLYVMKSPDVLRLEAVVIDEQITKLQQAKKKRLSILKIMEAPEKAKKGGSACGGRVSAENKK